MIPTKGDPSKTVATFFINNSRRYLAFGNFFHIRILSEDYFNAAKVFLQDADWPVREIGETDCRIYGIELLGREEFAPQFAKIDELVSTSGPMPVSLVNQQAYTQTAMLQFIDYNVNQAWAAVTALTAKVDAIAACLGELSKT